MSLLPWSHLAAEVPASGRQYRHSATTEERAAIAAELGLVECRRLEAVYTLSPRGGGRYAMKGQLSGDVVQSCIVTVEPVEGTIAAPLDCIFDPDPDAAALPAENEEVELSTLPDVEPIEHGRLETGRVAFETFAAYLDPFPRKADAEFRWDDPKVAAGGNNPFAVLQALKAKQDKPQS